MFSKTHLFVVLAMCLMALSTSAQSLPAMGQNRASNGNYPFGDLNHDWEVNLADLNVLIGVILGDEPPTYDDSDVNMTIAEFKAKHWQDARNYADTITDNEIIHGWVVSSDESGNIYKNLFIMDESGAGIPIAINQTKLYQDYPIGQEIVLHMKGYWVGKYNGLQELGYPYWYQNGQTWEVSFLPKDTWQEMVTLKGTPDPSRVQPIEISLDEIAGKDDAATLQKYQGALVCIKGVTFVDADGTTTFSEPNASTNRTLVDDNGNTLVVRTSNYADFKDDILPSGKVDVVGVMTMYATTWQLYLRDRNDVTAAQ